MKNLPSRFNYCGFCGAKDHQGFYEHVTGKVCLQCGKEFRRLYELNQHLNEAHYEKKRCFCRHCETWFPSRYLLLSHLKSKCMRPLKRRFGCKECGVRLASRNHSIRHKLLHRSSQIVNKAESKKLLQKKSKLKNFPSLVKVKTVRCKFCTKKYRNESSLALHYRLRHSETRLQCPQCSDTLSSCTELDNHVRVHHSTMYRCYVCQVRVRSVVALRSHIQLLHYQYYQCKTCRLSFESEQAFQKHTEAHEAGSCSYCYRPSSVCSETCSRLIRTLALKDVQPLIPQSSTRKDANEINCQICLKTFPSDCVHLLECHFAEHTSTNVPHVIQCEMCDYTTLQGFLEIYRHMTLKHPNDFKSCSDCLMSFTHESALILHKNRCSGALRQAQIVKTMKTRANCEICDLRFLSIQKASEHNAKIHKPECGETFACLLCHFTTSIGTEFQSHMSEGHPLELFECDKCTHVYCDVNELKCHLISEHKPPEVPKKTASNRKRKRSESEASDNSGQSAVGRERNCSKDSSANNSPCSRKQDSDPKDSKFKNTTTKNRKSNKSKNKETSDLEFKMEESSKRKAKGLESGAETVDEIPRRASKRRKIQVQTYDEDSNDEYQSSSNST